MGWIKSISRYRDERDQLIQYRHFREKLESDFKAATENLRPRDEDYQFRVGEFFAELDSVNAEIAEIETAQMKRRAGIWRIPIPGRPREDGAEDEFWTWHDVHGRYYISERGMRQLRRDIHEEWEMWWKPWLSWLALGVSLFSLAISIFKP